MAEKKKLTELLHLREVVILAYFIFVKHGYLQLGGYGCQCSHSLRYHSYLISFSYDLKKAVEFVYGTILAVGKKLATYSGKRAEQDVGRRAEPT